MTLLWFEGFEAERSSTYQNSSYADVTHSNPLYIPGQNSNYAMLLHYIAPGSYLTTKDLATDDTYIIGFRLQVQVNSLPSSNYDLVGFNYDGDRHVSIGIHEIDAQTYSLHAYSGTTSGGSEIGSGTSAIAAGNGWNYFEIKVRIHATLGTVDIRMNESSIFSISGQNTTVGVTALINNVVFGGRGGTSASYRRMAIDDIYILSVDGSAPNTFLGEQIIEALQPSAAGDDTDWASEENGASSALPNYAQVTETANDSTPRDDANYVASGTISEQDLYNFTDLAQITSGVTGVRVLLRARIETTGSHDVAVVYNNGTTEADMGSVAIGANHTLYSHWSVVTARDPISLGAYDVSEINGGQFGIRVTS